MLIKKIKWDKHPILGDLCIDLSNSINGEIYKTIVIVGENGTGKTTILESLSRFLNADSFKHFDYIEYTVNGELFKAVQSSNNPGYTSFYDRIMPDGSIKLINSDKSNAPSSIEDDMQDIRRYGFIYSKARADYHTQKIVTTTTKSVDRDRYNYDSDSDYTSLKQLLIDIEGQDNADYMRLSRNSEVPINLAEFNVSSRTYRFRKTFDQFFENLKYAGLEDDKEKVIYFEKTISKIPIDKLSTGEKQIVFRGAYLLKNASLIKDGIVMIDEPELSMHPKWQKKILQYYRNLFTSEGNQLSQMIFASHSEHILSEALNDRLNTLVIILKEANGVIESKNIENPYVLPSITAAETNYLAFDIVSNDLHIALYGWIQERMNKNSIKDCDEFILAHRQFENSIHYKESNYGRTTYRTLSTFIRNRIHHPDTCDYFSEEELRTSIDLLIKICKEFPNC